MVTFVHMTESNDSYVDDSRMYPIADVARVFGVSAKTIRRWEASGKISAERTPTGHRRFSGQVINELLKKEST